MISTNENLLLWEQWINEKNKSGITVKEWCEKNGISKHKYNYWNHKIITRKENPIDEIPNESKVINIKEHKRPVRKKGDRENLIKRLPHEIVECILEAEEAVCKICGSELKIIGKKTV